MLMRDNDAKYSRQFDEVFTTAGFGIKRTTPMSPNLRAHVERFIQSLKHECLNKFVIVVPHQEPLLGFPTFHRYTVADLRFPFWILIPRDPDGSPVHDGGCDAPSHVSIFSTAARAVAYMETVSAGEWDVRLVSRISRPEIAAWFERHGVARVCFNQNPDGTGGTDMTVGELLDGWEL